MPRKLIKKEEGSIVLEATLILPFVILFLLLITSFIRIAVVEMELENAGSETVKQLTHHIYPAVLIYKEFATDSAQRPVADKLDGFTLLDLLTLAKGQLEASALTRIFETILDGNTNNRLIDLRYYQVTEAQLPAALGGSGDTISLQLRYDLPLQIPFVNKSITIIKNFEEKIWYPAANAEIESVGDQEATNQEDEAEYYLKIHSISSPVQRGRYVKIIIEGTPKQNVRIRLTYNSGFVKEVEGTTNDQGSLAKDIIIGGHSNEGGYVATVFLGDLTSSIDFNVLSKANMQTYLNDRRSLVQNR